MSATGKSAPPRITLQHRVEYAALRLLAGIVRLFPLDMASAGMGAIWQTLAPLTRRQKRAESHLAFAMPELTPAERRRIVKQMWNNYGRVMAETIQLDRLAADSRRVVVAPGALNVLTQPHEKAVFVAMHMANWEVAVLSGRPYGQLNVSVYQSVQNPLIDRWLLNLRRPLYEELLPKAPSTARHLLAHVKRGGTVAILGDLREGAGISVPFFGHPALANPFPALLARSNGGPLYAVLVRRLEGATFLVDAARVEVPETDDRQADVHAATAGLHRQFETWIRETPGQWMWTHRKWAVKNPRRGLQRRAAAGEAAPDTGAAAPDTPHDAPAPQDAQQHTPPPRA